MRYRTILLDIPFDTARRRISDSVTEIRSKRQDDSIEYSSHSGFRLATLPEVELPNGEMGCKLRYRTTMISPVASRARRQARAIRDAVDDERLAGAE